jgi:FkbM family methyltransferase
VGFAREYLQPGMVVVDVGANIGYFTLIFAARVGSSGQVHAFEPTAKVAERLRYNVTLNGFKSVVVNELAVSDSIGTGFLNSSADDFEANSLFDTQRTCERAPVSVTTLDAYVDSRKLENIAFVKIDCEGSELKVIDGASRLLSTGPTLLFECNPATLSSSGSSVSELCGRLKAASYNLYCVEELRPPPENVWNLAAVRADNAYASRVVETLSLAEVSPARLVKC